jgi:Fe-S-cluster-containing dehydrogenase component
MAMNRRDFLKVSAGSGLLLASNVKPCSAKQAPAGFSEAVGILYDATLCIGCKSCMVNCKKYNAMPGGALYQEDNSVPYELSAPLKIYDSPEDLSDKTLNIIKAYKSGTGVNKDAQENGYSFIKYHCLHCLDPACASVCPVGALKKEAVSGIVTYDKKKCIGCRYCQLACPFGIPKFEWHKTSPAIVKCQLCHHRYVDGKYSACCEFCPTGASIFGKVKDLRAEAKRRLALKPGDTYEYPIKTVDSTQKSVKKIPDYVDHVYGMTEAGGTQYLLMAGVDFAKLGFNPAIEDMTYPDLTWDYISHVPILIGLLLVAGTASHIVTKRKDKKNKEV